jgi:rod shape-determining protein MreC
MESFFTRYRNLLVLLVLLAAQFIGLAMQVRRTVAGENTLDTSDSRSIRLIRVWAATVITPFERILQGSTSGVRGLWANYIDLRHEHEQNIELQKTIDRMRLEEASMLEDARQGQRLQDQLGFQKQYIYQTKIAAVIGGSGTDHSRVLYINKGSSDGLAHDMAVIVPNGIVGKVREVFSHSAQVLVINDQTSGAGVILETTRIRGILRGNANGQTQIIGILADQRIQPGERVLTAGGDQIFPRGLPVGVVKKVVQDPDRDGFIDIYVEPYAPLNRIDEVQVITSMQPVLPSDQLQDLAKSEMLKGNEAAAIRQHAIDEQKKAAALLAERLPGLTDPNAPPSDAPKPADTDIRVPTPLKPKHPDRFSSDFVAKPGTQSPGDEQPAAKPKADATGKPKGEN